jgi:opacity protein-like surface antigen
MSFTRTLALSVVVGIVIPATARADGMVVPFIGVNFTGSSGNALSHAINVNRFDWGVSLAYMGGGFLGIEADVGYTPDFYGRTDIGGSSVFTAMGNLLVGIPFGGQEGVGVRPYGLAGLGLIRSEVAAFGDVPGLDNSNPGWSAGGGAMFFFGTHVGLRTEVRYFRTFRAIDFIDVTPRRGRLDFTRASTGLIVRF